MYHLSFTTSHVGDTAVIWKKVSSDKMIIKLSGLYEKMYDVKTSTPTYFNVVKGGYWKVLSLWSGKII